MTEEEKESLKRIESLIDYKSIVSKYKIDWLRSIGIDIDRLIEAKIAERVKQ